ncbi:VOC family protein [Flavobacterium sp.]|uniref:bleomycin resistance protein n=1 Tax=Flavobacterium sp. TaxID=239 RepID=UPI002609AA53|nr:VOC family protein [Flavobacterium sp.]MDD2986937.1 VOC family protein [Flavobacterium sp.]
MLTAIHPKLPMRKKAITTAFYINQLGFSILENTDFDGYLLLQKEAVQLHFFEFKELNPYTNYGQVYIRTNAIESLYSAYFSKNIIHPNGHLELKPWGLKEFSILDPDHNLLTFGETI